MRANVMEIRSNKRESQQSLRLDKGTKDALADYCRRRWPHHTAKYAAREWDLSVDEGRGVIAGRASQTTIDKIYKAGGLRLAILILEEVTGESIARVIHDIRGVHNDHQQRIEALGGEARPLPPPGPPHPLREDLGSSDGQESGRRRVG